MDILVKNYGYGYVTVTIMNQIGLPQHLLDVCSTQTFSFVEYMAAIDIDWVKF